MSLPPACTTSLFVFSKCMRFAAATSVLGGHSWTSDTAGKSCACTTSLPALHPVTMTMREDRDRA